MASKNKPGTVQFRTALLRKLKNLEPDYKVEFFATEGRTVFRMIDKLGRPRSKKISISALAPDSLQKQYLQWHLKWADFPKKHSDTDH